mmetsp:Transcript_7987/g.19437  ORF Transcript_7987/g.19437 Transcript_7987/m.19437 type:complete len:222 (+) Transcript_7987:1536-2201(+)
MVPSAARVTDSTWSVVVTNHVDAENTHPVSSLKIVTIGPAPLYPAPGFVTVMSDTAPSDTLKSALKERPEPPWPVRTPPSVQLTPSAPMHEQVVPPEAVLPTTEHEHCEPPSALEVAILRTPRDTPRTNMISSSIRMYFPCRDLELPRTAILATDTSSSTACTVVVVIEYGKNSGSPVFWMLATPTACAARFPSSAPTSSGGALHMHAPVEHTEGSVPHAP